jgi:hypothetical protein
MIRRKDRPPPARVALAWNNACSPHFTSVEQRHTFRKHQMGYQDIDREIAHLEVVFGLISKRESFPLAYWHQRLRALRDASMMPAQRVRVERLEATLRAVVKAKEAVCAER